MTAPDTAPATDTRLPRSLGGAIDVPASARLLLAELLARPLGQVSPSVYETARLVRLAPWLTGHAARVRFLLTAQNGDGSWGGPDGYGVVPTLSATDALLHTLAGARALPASGVPLGALVDATRRGLAVLAVLLGESPQPSLPDTPAIEIIVPSLVAALNAGPDDTGVPRAGPPPVPGLRPPPVPRLHLPPGLDDAPIAAVRGALSANMRLPTKLLHSLEVAGTAAAGANLRPQPPGLVGASPAATAAWLGPALNRPVPAGGPDHPSARFLDQLVRLFDGPVPSVFPITVFERAWVIGALVTAGVDVPVPEPLVRHLRDALTESGTAGGPGLPPDADTTGAVLYALSLLGVAANPRCLWQFETDTHFRTWQGERTPSTTTNAHVLDALLSIGRGRHGPSGRGRRPVAAAHTGGRHRVWPAAEKVSRWLCEQQLADGSWVDKWHASPYYATSCCAQALTRHGGAGPAAAVRRATGFVLDSQRADGSWGRWAGTAEETAYALQTLLSADPAPGALSANPARGALTDGPRGAGEPAATGRAVAAADAIVRGYRYLLRAVDGHRHPPLWHDKDLYTPAAVVRSAILVALHMAGNRPDILARAL